MADLNSFLHSGNCFYIKDTSSRLFTETVNLNNKVRNNLLIKEVPYSYSLNTYSLKLKNHINSNYDMSFFVILICTVIITIAKVIYSKKTTQIIKSFFIPRLFNIFLRETDMFRERIIVLLFLNFVLTGSFIIFIIFFKEYNFSISKSIITLLVNNILFFIVCSSKFVFISFSGIIFKTVERSKELSLLNILFCSISGFLLWISLFFLCYSNILYVFEIVIAIMLLLYVYMVIKEFFIIFKQIKFSRFYIIVYFCTLEILPIILFVMFFNTQGILFLINKIY